MSGDPRVRPDIAARAAVALEPRRTGDQTRHSDSDRLDLHPDDLLGNESVRALCAHYLGHEAPVQRQTLIKWRNLRGFPDPLPCPRAGVELWDARQVRAWVQEHARARAPHVHGT